VSDQTHKVVVMAHCHLNSNTKVRGLACYSGARLEVVLPYLQQQYGIVQLPCPEATFLGMKRWGMTREQFDTPAYRRHCETLLGPVIDTLRALAEDACSVECVVGVDGSPSCGVNRTCVGYEGGEVEDLARNGSLPSARLTSGYGIFMEILRERLVQAGLKVEFGGVDEGAPASAGGR